MKAICLTLAFLFAALACYPCTDDSSCADEKRTGKTFTTLHHGHAPEEIDLCSPFCVCNCCSTQINQPSYFRFEVFIRFYADADTVLKDHFIKSVDHSIWQPPRLH